MERRTFMKASLAGIGIGLFPNFIYAKSSTSLGHVVIVGGGFGGATAAKYLRMWSNGRVSVTLIEARSNFISCPLSNRILAGIGDLESITYSYQSLKEVYGVQLIQGQASHIDPDQKKVHVGDQIISYDRLIIATGVDFNYKALPMLNAEIQATSIPHAWKAGAQTMLLRNQLLDMKNGGVVAITIPMVPYRCPPGPYERACQIAYYLKQHKPKSKVLVIDANPAITSKRPLFERAWNDLYPNIIEYLPSSEIEKLNVKNRTVTTTFGRYQVEVLNLIPPQTAGVLSINTGLQNPTSNWCDVNPITYESKRIPFIHVLGDSVDAPTPKSAHVATSQAKVCASAIISELTGEQPDQEPVFANTCYSFVDDKKAVHVANVYRYDMRDSEMKAAPGGGISAIPTIEEGKYADIWAKNIWADVLGY